MKHFRIFVLVLLVTLSPNSALADSPLPGMPSVIDASDIYAADRPNALSPKVRGIKELVYVPNHSSNTVSVIDPVTYKVIKTFKTPAGPQHVVPSWDLKTLWVNDNEGNYLTPINPRTVTVGKSIYVHDPYNLYFTPNGKYAVVMGEAKKQIVFRDSQTMEVKHVLKVPCSGVNHADWSMDGSYFIATCEFSGSILKIDTQKMKILYYLKI